MAILRPGVGKSRLTIATEVGSTIVQYSGDLPWCPSVVPDVAVVVVVGVGIGGGLEGD